MKFQKGSKVEVMNKTELPTSWCVAEVVSVNKNTYNLRYDCFPGVEEVSREFIRPCPPNNSQSWVAGDIVEAFDDNSWKTATVCNVYHGGHFSLRLHGFVHKINVHKSKVRARQSWHYGQWVPLVKISGSYGDMNGRKMVEPNFHAKLGLQIPMPNSKNNKENENNLLVYIDGEFQESQVASSKRASPFCSSILEASPNKLKASKKGKVDVFACPEEKNIQQPFSFYNNIQNVIYEKESKLKPHESNNIDCSVGSCSDGSYKLSSGPHGRAISSDTESFNTSRDEEGVTENLHNLELHAYRSTLEALYASGPLSWDKEALLTNLRINLHISNDEHLKELRNLISLGVGGGGILE